MRRLLPCFALLFLSLVASVTQAGPRYYWTTTSYPPLSSFPDPPSITSFTGFIEFEPGQEGYSYYIRCSSVNNICSGTVNGNNYSLTDISDPAYGEYTKPFFSPVIRAEFRINGGQYPDAFFYKNSVGGGCYGALGGTGFWFSLTTMCSSLRFSDPNTVSGFFDYNPNVEFTGPVTGYWTLDPASVPIPATLVLLGLGLVGIGAARRKQA